MIGAIEVNTAWLVGALVLWVITQILSGIFSSWLTLRLLKQQTEGLAAAIRSLTDTVRQHDEQLAALRMDRVNCELRAAGQYAHRGELVRAVTDQTSAWRRVDVKLDSMAAGVRDSVSKVHKRVDELVVEVAEIKAAAKGEN